MLFCLVIAKILGGQHLTHDSTQQEKLVIIPESVDSLKIQMLDFNFSIGIYMKGWKYQGKNT